MDERKKTSWSEAKHFQRKKTYVITNVREISFQRPFPSAVRPCRKARCSSAVQGEPSEAATPAAANGAAATPTAPSAAACIGGAAAGTCAASRAGVIEVGDLGGSLHEIARVLGPHGVGTREARGASRDGRKREREEVWVKLSRELRRRSVKKHLGLLTWTLH